MNTAGDLVRLHLDSCRFREADTANTSMRGYDREFSAVARLGQRLLRLDLERVDLADHPELAEVLPTSLGDRLSAVQFPRQATSPARGPLGSFIPLTELLLEVLAIRWRRRESLHVLALIHLVAEYSGHLVWESALDHAADPIRLAGDVSGRASLWGQVGDNDCGHARSQQHLAARVRDNSMARSDKRWAEFLHEDYSRLGELLSVCAVRGSMRTFGRRVRSCDVDCSVWTRRSHAERESLEARARLAVLFSRSPLIQLRHSAPIGHFFGVPDLGEITAAWSDMAVEVERRTGVSLVTRPGREAMPDNVATLCRSIAGAEITPTTLVADVVEHLKHLLGES
ncbi:MAG: hypothetical protein GY708_01235 [Actinomycetia bacterium]|nr:hypothetical protein [Actinomycetes bacterium]MCP4963541.1 hypothetical protein [Actinomycetes bacterium]